MADCQATMSELLKDMLIKGFGTDEDASEDRTGKLLQIKQVKSTDTEANLRRVYPSKTDLIFEDNEHIIVERE